MDANFVSRYHDRMKADPRVALMSNIKAPFGKWDALFSRYEYPFSTFFLEIIFFTQFERASNIPCQGWVQRTHQNCLGFWRFVCMQLTFLCIDHIYQSDQPNIHLVGVGFFPGCSYFLRSRFKRRRSPYQETPVYKVLFSNLSITQKNDILF